MSARREVGPAGSIPPEAVVAAARLIRRPNLLATAWLPVSGGEAAQALARIDCPRRRAAYQCARRCRALGAPGEGCRAA